jgi:hypothetical protein
VEKEVGRHLRKAKLPGCYDRLVKLITGFKNPVRGAHANWEKARPNHDRIKMSGVSIIGNISQTEGSWVLKELRVGIRKEVWVIKASVENLEPTGSIRGIQFPARETVEGLPKASTSNVSPTQIREGITDQGREIRIRIVEVKTSPQLNEPPWTTGSNLFLGKEAGSHQVKITVEFPQK